MFIIVKGTHPKVSHGRIDKLMIDPIQDSASIQYQEGYMDGDKFVSLGVNSITLKDKPATETEKAVPAYSNFMREFSLALANQNEIDFTEGWLAKRLQ